MFDLDQLHGFFENLDASGLSLETLSFEQIADALTHAGIDVSSLSPDQLHDLIESASTQPDGVAQPSTGDGVKFGTGQPSVRFDVPGAVSAAGNAVGSDSSGNLVDKVTGEGLSKY